MADAAGPTGVDLRLLSAADACALGWQDRHAAQAAGRWDILTAWYAGGLAGSACLRWEGPLLPEPAATFPGQAELAFVQVVEAARSRGIGTAIVRAAEARCLLAGRGWLGLGVADDNPRAQRLYTRLGYVPTDVTFAAEYVDDDGRPHTEVGRYLVTRLAGARTPIR